MTDHCAPHVFYCLSCAVNFKTMKVNFIDDTESGNAGNLLYSIDMDFIPRKGEKFTFSPSDDRPDYEVTDIEYTIENNKLKEVDVWVA